jgi:hypothetical protein
MLSPNATKLVAAIVGIFGGTNGWTTTGKVHESLRLCESVAVQTTVVEPTGNVLPLAGTHDAVTDGVPPFTDAAPYVTGKPARLDAGVGTGGAGHRIFGPVVDGLVGAGDDPQAPVSKAAKISVETNVKRRRNSRPSTQLAWRRCESTRPVPAVVDGHVAREIDAMDTAQEYQAVPHSDVRDR